MKKHIALVLVAAFALSGCGKKNGIGDVTSPLTEAQTKKFEETMVSIGRAQQAIPTEGATELDPNDGGLAPMSFRAMATATAADPVTEEMKNRLRASQSRNECIIGAKFIHPDPENLGIVNMIVRVSGPKCAVSMRMVSNAVVDDKLVKGNLEIKYQVLTPEFRLLNDIDALELKMDFTSNNFVKDESGQLKVHVDGRGSFNSQKYGTIGFSQKGDIQVVGEGGGGQIVARITFNDMTVEMKEVVKGTKRTYFINSKQVSETEYNSFLLKAGLKGAAPAAPAA